MNTSHSRLYFRRNSFQFYNSSLSQEDDDGNEETNEQLRADFPILSEHGIMPVTDVNENFSSPINGSNEQDGFNGEPTQQPTTAINTDKFWPWNTWLDPDGNPAYYWMGVVTLAALYNLAIIIIRLTFSDMAANWSFLFILFDALSDIIYLIDIFVQFRVAYYDDGCLETDPKKTRNELQTTKQIFSRRHIHHSFTIFCQLLYRSTPLSFHPN